MTAEPAIERPMRRAPRDEVERDLLQARALVEAAMFKHRRHSASLVDQPGEDESWPRLVNSAKDELILVVSSGVVTSGDGLPEPLPRVWTRLLCPKAAVCGPRGEGFLGRMRDQGVEVRVIDGTVPELLLADERIGLIRSGRQDLVVRAPAMLQALRELFTAAWDTAGHATADPRWNGLNQQILELLAAGHKDDVAARLLGLSVRTYRRHVADIMRDMGAASRFQAGARAAELGLLPPQPTMPPSIWNTAPVM